MLVRPFPRAASSLLRSPCPAISARTQQQQQPPPRHYYPQRTFHHFAPYSLISSSSSSSSSSSTPMAAETDTQAAVTANTSGVTPDALKTTLEIELSAKYVDIIDISGGCGQSFQAIIVSPLFEKEARLDRHRRVNKALKNKISAIHAWSPKCFTPDEWEREKERGSD